MHWKDAAAFRFVRHGYDPATGEARLVYAFDDGPELVETYSFPDAPWPQDAARQAAFGRALAWLHLLAGVSYYKAGIPARMDTGESPLDAAGAAFLERLYVEGLAEFAHCNGVELEGRVRFQATAETVPPAASLALPERVLVAMGGGKDSLVTLELLREAGFEIQPACIGDSGLIEDTVQAAGLPLLRIRRRLAPELSEMNAQGALNGHVPVTAINSAALLCAALLYGYRHVVFSNERSADEATLADAHGRAVNHQYSKSLAFERGLRSLAKRECAADLEYFSLLRPLYELGVAQRFSRLDRYHRVFSSCNRNFHLDGRRVAGRWCGNCPKCRFTALALAPWLPPKALRDMMGAVPLEDEGQVDGFRALCRLGVDKPFECVGTVGECRAALCALGRNESWRDCAVVRALAPELAGKDVPLLDELLSARGPHCIPGAVLDRVAL